MKFSPFFFTAWSTEVVSVNSMKPQPLDINKYTFGKRRTFKSTIGGIQPSNGFNFTRWFKVLRYGIIINVITQISAKNGRAICWFFRQRLSFTDSYIWSCKCGISKGNGMTEQQNNNNNNNNNNNINTWLPPSVSSVRTPLAGSWHPSEHSIVLLLLTCLT